MIYIEMILEFFKNLKSKSLKLSLIKFFYNNCPIFIRCFTFITSERCKKIVYEEIKKIKNDIYKGIRYRPPDHKVLIQIYRLSMLASLLDDIELRKEVEKLFKKLKNTYREFLPSNHYIIRFLDYTYDIWFRNIFVIWPFLSSFRLTRLIKKSEGITLRRNLIEIFDLNFLIAFSECLEFNIIFIFILIFILFLIFLKFVFHLYFTWR